MRQVKKNVLEIAYTHTVWQNPKKPGINRLYNKYGQFSEYFALVSLLAINLALFLILITFILALHKSDSKKIIC